MADDQDETGGTASLKPDHLPDDGSGEEGGFLPPLHITVDLPDIRYAKLSKIVAEHVLPQLVAMHPPPVRQAPVLPLRTAAIDELAQLLLGPENEAASGFVMKLKDDGVSLDDLHAELLEPAARLLGELWTEDKADFLDVTIGISRLQRLVHVFEGLGQFTEYDDKRRVLLACAPAAGTYGVALPPIPPNPPKSQRGNGWAWSASRSVPT